MGPVSRSSGAGACTCAGAGTGAGALILIAVLGLLGVPAFGAPFSFRFEPEDPHAGELVAFIVQAEAKSAPGLDLAGLELDEHLALAGQALRPRILASGERGVELRLELRILAPGARKLSLSLRSARGVELFGPFSFVAAEARSPDSGQSRAGGGDEVSEPGDGGSAALPAWRWILPDSVLRYQAFPLSLAPAEGGEGLDDAAAYFKAPEGLSLEPTGNLKWLGIVLGGPAPAGSALAGSALAGSDLALGDLAMGEAEIRAERGKGRAPAAILRVKEPPRQLDASRAIGDFNLSIEGPFPARPMAHSPFRLLLVLKGEGNFPVLELPPPAIFLDSSPLPPSAIQTRRRDEIRPEGDSYRGRIVVELEAIAPRSGQLEIRCAPFPVLGGGGIGSLELPVLRANVAEDRDPSLAGSSSAAALGPFAAALDAASLLAASKPSLASLPGTVAALRGASPTVAAPPGTATAASAADPVDEPLDLIARSGAERGSRRAEALYLKAALLWMGGEEGRALALLYGYLRNPSGTALARRRAKAAALACASELGSGPPLLDALPSPRHFIPVAIVALLLGLGLGLALRPRARVRSRPAAFVSALILLLISVLAFVLVSVSAAERSRPFAVVWTDHVLTVPSAKAELAVSITRGATARIRGGAPGYAGIVFADGAAGWAPRESLYYY